MKRITSIICTAVLMATSIFATGCGGNNEFDNGKMRKDMTAVEYAEEMGLGINLGNTMDSFWEDTGNKCSGSSVVGEGKMSDYEKCWGAVETTQEAITGMKNAGFNTVRVPVYWGNDMENDGEFNISKDLLKRVEEIVNYCRNDDLYVIINIHHYDEFLVENYSKEEVLETTEKLWTQIADHFKNYSDFLVFEGFNEAMGTTRESDGYTEDDKFQYVNEMNQTFVDAVRKTGGNNKTRLLIASGYWTNIDLTTSDKFVMPKDSVKDKMMVSVHYVDNAMYWTNKIGNQEWLDYSKAQCELLKGAFTDKGIPVFVGECTSIYEAGRYAPNAMHKESTECLGIMYDMMLEYGFVPVLWDVNDNFYSRTDCRIKSDSDKALIEKLSAELKGK